MFAGFSHATTVASTNSLIQLTTGDALRGRVMSLFSTIFIGLMPVGSLLAGTLAQVLGAQATVAVFGLLCTFVALIYLHVDKKQTAHARSVEISAKQARSDLGTD